MEHIKFMKPSMAAVQRVREAEEWSDGVISCEVAIPCTSTLKSALEVISRGRVHVDGYKITKRRGFLLMI